MKEYLTILGAIYALVVALAILFGPLVLAVMTGNPWWWLPYAVIVPALLAAAIWDDQL